MQYDNDLIAAKLRRWEQYLEDFYLPKWNELPDIGLYMEQVVGLLKTYLDLFPPELKDDPTVTPATVNNYVRTGVMPKPIKKRYYRIHLAYLIMIVTMKQTLSISQIQQMIPVGITEEEAEEIYTSYTERYRSTAVYFAGQVRNTAGKILKHKDLSPLAVETTEDMLTSSVIISGFAKLFAEKLILLDGHSMADGDDISVNKKK